MISPTRMAKLLVDGTTQREDLHRRETRSNPHEEEIINSLLKMIDDVCNYTSYQIESDTTLDYDDEEGFGDFEDEDVNSADESVDPCFDETAESKNMTTKANFSLEYMRKVSDYFDARDSKGRKRHIWKSTQNRFKSIPQRQYITRFRHYTEQHGTKREKLQIIDDLVYDMFEEARENVLPVHDRDLREGYPPPTYPHFLSVCRVRSQGSRVKIFRGLDALWRSYKNFKN